MERLFRDAEGDLVEIDDESVEFGLVEEAIEKAAVLDLVENKAAVARLILRGGVDELAPEDLAGPRHAQAAVGVALLEAGELLLIGDALKRARLSHANHEACFAGADAEAELNELDGLFGGALFKDLDLITPLALFATFFPGFHALAGPLTIGDHLEEVGEVEVPFLKGVGDVVPELYDVGGRRRPENERFEAVDGPAGVEPHDVGVENLALELEATVAALDLAKVFVFLSGEATPQFVLDYFGEGFLPDLVWCLGEISFAGDLLQHCCVESGAARVTLFIGLADPFISLQLDAGPARPVFVFDASLDEEVVAENLRDGPFIVKALAFLLFVMRE